MSAASDSNFSSVSNTSFLYNLCDFHLNYAGCGRDVEKFLTFDIFMMALHSLTIATLSLALVQKFCVFKSRTCSANMPAWKLMDTVK